MTRRQAGNSVLRLFQEADAVGDVAGHVGDGRADGVLPIYPRLHGPAVVRGRQLVLPLHHRLCLLHGAGGGQVGTPKAAPTHYRYYRLLGLGGFTRDD